MVEYTYREILNITKTRNTPYKERRENGGDGQPIYVGEAEPGTATSSPGWRIQLWTYSGGLLTQIDWAEGTREFDKVWDDRAGYSYS